MDLNKTKVIWMLAGIEFSNLVRSTKIIILAIFVIFIHVQIITPLRELSMLMGAELSIFEPFAAIGNSGIVVLILPLFFITMFADFPREGKSRYFYQVRCSKGTWIAGQIVYAAESAIALTLFVFMASVLLSLRFTDCNSDYSYAVTRYVASFPERAGEYVVQLIPENLYNQITLVTTVIHTAMLLVSYFIMLALIIFIFSLIHKKIIGLLLDGFLIITGTITCAVRSAYMWIFPMSHTITWLHYAEYQSKEIFPLLYSYIYFGVINLTLIFLAFVLRKQYSIV